MTDITLLTNVAIALFLFLPNADGLPPAGARIPGCQYDYNEIIIISWMMIELFYIMKY